MIGQFLTKASGRVRHGGPVWFVDGDPIAGYWVRKNGVQLQFRSVQSFDELGLKAVGKLKPAEATFTAADQFKAASMHRWLKAAMLIPWDYKNIVERRGRPEKKSALGDGPLAGAVALIAIPAAFSSARRRGRSPWRRNNAP